jgi:hypothetical protein
LGDLLARRWAQHLVAGQHALDQRLHRAAVAFSPSSRALMTRVSLNTSRSPGCSSAGSRGTRGPPARRPRAVEQARGAALGRRVLGDQLGRQFEVEVGSV